MPKRSRMQPSGRARPGGPSVALTGRPRYQIGAGSEIRPPAVQALHQHHARRRRARSIDHEVEAFERGQVGSLAWVRGRLEALDAEAGGEMHAVEDEPGAQAPATILGIDGDAQARHLWYASLEGGRRHHPLAVAGED